MFGFSRQRPEAAVESVAPGSDRPAREPATSPAMSAAGRRSAAPTRMSAAAPQALTAVPLAFQSPRLESPVAPAVPPQAVSAPALDLAIPGAQAAGRVETGMKSLRRGSGNIEMICMHASDCIVVSLIAGPALIKLVLIILWVRQLHARHAARYRFGKIFFMMFGPHSEKDMDPALWADFKPIQRMNFLSNIILGCCASALFILLILSKKAGY